MARVKCYFIFPRKFLFFFLAGIWGLRNGIRLWRGALAVGLTFVPTTDKRPPSPSPSLSLSLQRATHHIATETFNNDGTRETDLCFPVIDSSTGFTLLKLACPLVVVVAPVVRDTPCPRSLSPGNRFARASISPPR